MLDRSEKVCSELGRNGPKRWKSEQLLLHEIEFEWLRQFFIQGEGNKRLLWGYWEEPIQKLFHYWEKLEARTRQVLLILQYAAEERCGVSSSSSVLREERSKSLTLIHDIVGQRSPKGPIYDSFTNLLQQRSKKREQWLMRETDTVFKHMPPVCRPIPFPAAYGSGGPNSNEEDLASSAMPDGSSGFLSKLARNVATWGRCYENRRSKELPKGDLLDSASNPSSS